MASPSSLLLSPPTPLPPRTTATTDRQTWERFWIKSIRTSSASEAEAKKNTKRERSPISNFDDFEKILFVPSRFIFHPSNLLYLSLARAHSLVLPLFQGEKIVLSLESLSSMSFIRGVLEDGLFAGCGSLENRRLRILFSSSNVWMSTMSSKKFVACQHHPASQPDMHARSSIRSFVRSLVCVRSLHGCYIISASS